MTKPVFRIKAVPDFPAISPDAIVNFFAEPVNEGANLEGVRYQWYCINDPNVGFFEGNFKSFWVGPRSDRWEDTNWTVIGSHRVILRVTHQDGSHEVYERTQRVDSASVILDKRFDPEDNDQDLDPFQSLELAKKKLWLLEGIGKVKPPSEDQKEAFETQLNQQKAYVDGLEQLLEGVHGRRGHAVDAIHLESSSQRDSRLKLWLVDTTDADSDEFSWRLIDWTNPAYRQLRGTYDGFGDSHEEAIKDCLNTWDSAWFEVNNRYPDGLIQYDFNIPTHDIHLTGDFETDGSTFWDSVTNFFTAIALGTAATALIFAPVPGSRVASVAIWSSLISGTVASAINFVQRKTEGVDDWKEDAFDVLGIVGGLFGMGAIRLTRGAVLNLGRYASSSALSKAVFYGQFTNDTLQGILLGYDYATKVDELMNDPRLSPDDRMNKLLRLLAQAAAEGAITYLAVKGSKSDIDAINQGQVDIDPRRLTDPEDEITLPDQIEQAVDIPEHATRAESVAQQERRTGGLDDTHRGARIRNVLKQFRNKRVNPQSFEEAKELLKDALEELLNNPNAKALKYSVDELQLLASVPELKNKYIVRMVEAKYAGPDGNLSRAVDLPDGTRVVKHWSTSFDMIHWADSDPELIRRAIGFSSNDFKPPYKLAIIDLEKYKAAAGAEAFIPTFEEMNRFAKTLKLWDPHQLDQVTNAEFNAKYQGWWEEIRVQGLESLAWDAKAYEKFKNSGIIKKAEDLELFEVRLDIQKQLGAYDVWEGNGMTKYVKPEVPDKFTENQEHGVLEYFFLEKNPKTIGELTEGENPIVEMVELDFNVTGGDSGDK